MSIRGSQPPTAACQPARAWASTAPTGKMSSASRTSACCVVSQPETSLAHACQHAWALACAGHGHACGSGIFGVVDKDEAIKLIE
ncbi:MAG: hypothetical protein QM742_05420 [Aquabacterium sp.]